jgi:ABC-2 type transport system ATP-binding protein
MVVEVKNLVKRYDKLVALDHLNLIVEKGELFGLLGPNGSGKTTAMNCILSLIKYDKGTIEIFGKTMKQDAFEIKRNIGFIMQDAAVFEELTVYENVSYFCSLYIKDVKEVKRLTEEAIAFISLEDFVRFPARKLSDGLKSRLNFACGIAHKPKLIILDEPADDVDPHSRNKILDGIKKLNEAGTTILYTAHNMEEVEQLCTTISLIDKGKIIAAGTKDELKNMISIGEKITVEAYNMTLGQLDDLKRSANVNSVSYHNNLLEIKSKKGKNNLIHILDFLQKNDINFGKIYTELPTLNDVFLEITGKEI